MADFPVERATLVLNLADWAGDDLDTVVNLRLSSGARSLGAFTVDVQRSLEISQVPFGTVKVDARPRGFRARTFDILVDAPTANREVRFEFDSAMVLDIRAPEFDQLDRRLREFLDESELDLEGRRRRGADLYTRFSAASKAVLLNTFTKAVATMLPVGGSVWEQFQGLRAVDMHSVIAVSSPLLLDVRRALRLPAAISAGSAVSGAGMDNGFRTLDSAGSLNVEMFRGAAANNLAAVTVLGGSGRPESPYAVRDILVRQQHLIPDYRPLVRHRGAAARGDAVERIALAGEAVGRSILPGGRRFSRRRHASDSSGAGDGSPPSPPELFVNQGITDATGKRWAMEDTVRPGQPHFYWFQVSTDPNGANAETWNPTGALATTAATVQIQVTCDLLPGGYAARNVPYHPGVGLEYQTFLLNPLPGAHTLLVQMIHEARPVYSRQWTLTVREFQAGEGAPPPSAETVAPDPLPESAESVARLIADATYATRLSLDLPGQVPFRGADPPQPGSLIQLAAAARGTLNEFARNADVGRDLAVDWADAWAFLRKMAIWGVESAEQIFGTRQAQAQFYRALDLLPSGSSLHINSNPGSFPWEWLYLREVPPPDPPALGSDALAHALDGFLGFRFRCDVLPASDVDRIGQAEVLSNTTRTRILSAVNATADAKAAPENLTFVRALETWPAVEAQVCQSKGETVLALRTTMTAQTPLHLLYVYCHHTPGAQLSDLGYNNFGDSTLFMKGKSDDPISRREMQFESGLTPFKKSCAPLVMLNACGTSLGNDYYPSGFLPYFTNKLLVPTVIGTVAEVPTLAGYQFAQQFIPAWLATHSVHRAIADIRREWLLGKGNPFAMYYTVYGNGHLRLQQQTSRPSP
ncbi:MAG TPA: hypothetical protein VM032_01505 [Vicinamibacterales bacterium]|nr:hypothetical protein [Vicinamibacterales bacterium]